MPYYQLYNSLGSAWCNEDLRHLEKTDFYIDKIPVDSFYSDDQPIRLYVDYFDSAKKYSFWKYLDFFTWNFGKPSANILIVSSKMRKLIDGNLKLPPHKYYSSIINNYILDQTSNDYFVLHFIHDFYDNIDYEKSEFGIIDRR